MEQVSSTIIFRIYNKSFTVPLTRRLRLSFWVALWSQLGTKFSNKNTICRNDWDENRLPVRCSIILHMLPNSIYLSLFQISWKSTYTYALKTKDPSKANNAQRPCISIIERQRKWGSLQKADTPDDGRWQRRWYSRMELTAIGEIQRKSVSASTEW